MECWFCHPRCPDPNWATQEKYCGRGVCLFAFHYSKGFRIPRIPISHRIACQNLLRSRNRIRVLRRTLSKPVLGRFNGHLGGFCALAYRLRENSPCLCNRTLKLYFFLMPIRNRSVPVWAVKTAITPASSPHWETVQVNLSPFLRVGTDRLRYYWYLRWHAKASLASSFWSLPHWMWAPLRFPALPY